MEHNYLELATNAIAIKCVRGDHENQNAPVHTINARVSHWEISVMTIHGTPIEDFCAKFDIDIDFLMIGMHNSYFKTKKEALATVIDVFAERIEYFDPEHCWNQGDEVINRMHDAYDFLKGGK